MLEFYLACLIIGGAFIVVSFFVGQSDDKTGFNQGEDHKVQSADKTELSRAETFGSHTLISYTLSEISKFFSFKNFTYFIAFFGLTGSALTLFHAGALITSIFSSAIGLIGWWLGYRLINYIQINEIAEQYQILELKGKTGTVIYPISKSKKGKISTDLYGRKVQITAALSDDSRLDELPLYSKALIIDMKQNYVYVVESEI